MALFFNLDLIGKINEEPLYDENSNDTDTTSSTPYTASSDSLTPEVSYLMNTLGAILKKALAEIVEKQPRDPIHYLARWLYSYRLKEETGLIKQTEMQALMEERKKYFADKQHAELVDESRNAFWEMVRNAEDIALRMELYAAENEGEQDFREASNSMKKLNF